jgi:hypothetical protein
LSSKKSQFLVVLSVRHCHTRTETRYVVPLENAMEYVRFSRTGRHTIHAAVIQVSGNSWEIRAAKNEILKQDARYEYTLSLFNGSGEFFPHRIQMNKLRVLETSRHICDSAIDVVVAEDLFAKKPPAWLERWVNLWHETPHVDQCMFKKRMIPALTIQPPVMLVFLLAKYFIFAPISIAAKFAWAIIGTLMGMRWHESKGINWSKVFNPFEGNPQDVWNASLRPDRYYDKDRKRGHCGGSFILYDREGEERKKIWWKLTRFFTPAPWMLILAIVSLITAANKGSFSSESAASALKLTGELLLITAAIMVISIAASFAVKKWRASSKKSVDGKKKEKPIDYEAIRTAEKMAFAKTFSAITCEAMPVEVDVDLLPPERRTFHLKLMKFKGGHCRPYPQD